MKRPLRLILLTLIVACIASPAGRAEPSAWPMPAAHDDSSHYLVTLIDPGFAVGPLKLGDSRDRALELFPKKDEDREWTDDCGATLDWVDTANPMGRGDVFIRLKKNKIFQIESSTTRFHTAEDITTFSDPEKIRSTYKGIENLWSVNVILLIVTTNFCYIYRR